jgi:hypothetical protein
LECKYDRGRVLLEKKWTKVDLKRIVNKLERVKVLEKYCEKQVQYGEDAKLYASHNGTLPDKPTQPYKNILEFLNGEITIKDGKFVKYSAEELMEGLNE